MARQKKVALTVSPQAKLAAVILSARDAMRKDAGLNGDLDRIPQLAWILEPPTHQVKGVRRFATARGGRGGSAARRCDG